jgi:cytohesin
MALSMKAQSVHNAASRGDIQTLLELIEEREVRLATTAAGWTLLHTIAQHDHDKVACLFDKAGRFGLDPNAKASMDETPLHVCAIYGSSKVCDWLLNQGGEPDVKDDNGWTPIHYAARFGHQNVLEELRKEHRRRTEQRLDQERKLRASMRSSASRSRNVEPVDEDDPSASRYSDPETSDGWTPLHVAARFEQVDIITYLLSSAADKEAKDNQGVLRACIFVASNQDGVPHIPTCSA